MKQPLVFPLLALVVACQKPAGDVKADPSVAAPGASAVAPADKNRFDIDPKLMEDGRVRLHAAEKRGLAAEVVLAGDAVPAEDGEAEVGALVGGRVATLDAAEGDRVKRGQVLARIDAPDAGRATAELLSARGRAFVAARKLARQLDLQKQEATSQNAVDEARAEDQAAQAELAAARTRAATVGAGEPAEDAGSPARGVVARVMVRSPIDGVVVRRDAVLGGPVTMERSLFRIVDPERLLVRARLPETHASAVGAGAGAVVRPRAAAGAAPVQPCDASVVSAFGVVDESTRTLPLRVRLSRPCPWLLPGAWVDVAIRGGAQAEGGAEGIVVPAEAVVEVRGVPTVFVAEGKPGSFVARAVRVGRPAGAGLTIEAGVAAGERVVTSGSLLLKGEMLRTVLGGD